MRREELNDAKLEVKESVVIEGKIQSTRQHAAGVCENCRVFRFDAAKSLK